jgi:hypothetical protein
MDTDHSTESGRPEPLRSGNGVNANLPHGGRGWAGRPSAHRPPVQATNPGPLRRP